MQLDAINASVVAVVGRDRIEAIEAAEALQFGLLDRGAYLLGAPQLL